jgi:hypothetical protein
VKGTDFDELAYFRAIAASGVRALLIGRRALVVLGLPVMTADYDFWLHIDDIEAFNRLSDPFDLLPTFPPDQARKRDRYALENDEHVDVLISRSMPTVGGPTVTFDEMWARRQAVPLNDTTMVTLPSVRDLILTKRFAARPKDLEDIRLIEITFKDQLP